ncbi:hypothetical protein C6A72_24250 [Escherichia coli]|nr:hypothetical protein C6A72_24250 [Escherichia coli]
MASSQLQFLIISWYQKIQQTCSRSFLSAFKKRLIPAISRQICNSNVVAFHGSDSNLLIVFYVQIMPDDLVMQLHRF